VDERKRPMALTKFLDPKNDVAFKKIFGTEKNKDILIHFLNDMLVFKEKKPIVDVSFLKTMQDPDISSKKTSVVDVLCTDQDKNTYVVEMVRLSSLMSHCDFIEQTTNRIRSILEPAVLPAEPTDRCGFGDEPVLSDPDNDPTQMGK
jgi:hypothetical protein